MSVRTVLPLDSTGDTSTAAVFLKPPRVEGADFLLLILHPLMKNSLG